MISAGLQGAAALSAIEIRGGLTQQIGHTSPEPILRWVSACLVFEDLQNGRELES
jgi:hypothetical protein